MICSLLLMLALECPTQDDDVDKVLTEAWVDQARSEAKAWLTEMEKTDLTFYKLHPKLMDKAEEGTFHRYRIVGQKAVSDTKVIETLRGILADPKTFHRDHWGCFSPGMGFRFRKGAQESDLVICLKCRRIVMIKGGESHNWELSEEGAAALLGVYDAVVTKPVRFAEEAKGWVSGLEKAEMQFLKISPEGTDKPGTFHGYPILLRSAVADPKIAEDLRAILADSKSFTSLEHKCFDPGMGVQFEAGGIKSDLVICLACHAMLAYRGKDTHYWLITDEVTERLKKIYTACDTEGEKK